MGYGLLDLLWVMICISLPTKSVDWLSYGISQVMGFHRFNCSLILIGHLGFPIKFMCRNITWSNLIETSHKQDH